MNKGPFIEEISTWGEMKKWHKNNTKYYKNIKIFNNSIKILMKSRSWERFFIVFSSKSSQKHKYFINLSKISLKLSLKT